MSPVAGWRLPLRLARRDALRHRARSVLVLVMIALPVLAVTTADVLLQTSQVSGPESVERRMGSAQAVVRVSEGVETVEQGPDPDATYPVLTGAEDAPAPTADAVSALLDGARLVPLRQGEVQLTTERGRTGVEALEVDLGDPVAHGMVDLTSGRLPRGPGEVVVNQATLDKGYAVGDTLDLAADGVPDPTVVGVVESASYRSLPVAAGPVGTLGVEYAGTDEWLVDGGPVSWAMVRQLNGIGALVTSRAVVDDPPPVSQWPPSVRPVQDDGSSLAVLGLIAVMVLIEVVLLAGPAFAVSARKQQRSLALVAASGGTPAQARRVVLAGAVVLGGVAAAVGVGLGLGLARLLQPFVQSLSDTWFGPFDVPWLHLLGVAAFGLVSAVLAAAVPAHLASRQDVVAVLAGRRGDRPPSLRSPALGVALLAVGVLGSVYGATRAGGGELAIAFSAIPAVLGMVLLVPVVLHALARVSGRLPLVLRYAVRDADRHRTRTVPAVAAVAATVAGVVALGIGLSSDQRENEATYQPSLPRDVAMVTGGGEEVSWSALASAVRRELPEATLTEQQGLDEYETYTEVRAGDEPLLASFGGTVGSSVMVSDDELPLGLLGLSSDDVARAEAALRAGRAVVFDGDARPDGPVRLVQPSYDEGTGAETIGASADAEATFVRVPVTWSGPAAVVPSAVAEELGAEPTTVSIAVTGPPISEAQEAAVDEALAGVAEFSSLQVERGYQPDDAARIAQLLLVVLGAVLMLGGTLTATFLALSDARPDLATLASVGASPRTRRGVAAAYAVVLGAVGAVLGAVVGAIPGIAVTRPLTRTDYTGVVNGPFLDIPWLVVLSLVVVLPLLTALVVGLSARSRLPMVARLD